MAENNDRGRRQKEYGQASQDEITLGGYVVCLLDVLGQSDRLADWAKLPEAGKQLPHQFSNAINATAGTVLRFARQFVDSFDRLQRRAVEGGETSVPPESQELYSVTRECQVKVCRFSDVFLFYSMIPTLGGHYSVDAVERILAVCCSTILSSLMVRAPIRGAIAIGLGAELSDGGFYGPALAQAHHLESKVAGYPRVIVSESAVSFVKRGFRFSRDENAQTFMEVIASGCRSLICPDADGCWIVDFLGKGYRDIAGHNEQWQEGIRIAYNFVRSEWSRFQVEGNSKLALRYYWLKQYMESRLPLWGLTSEETNSGKEA